MSVARRSSLIGSTHRMVVTNCGRVKMLHLSSSRSMNFESLESDKDASPVQIRMQSDAKVMDLVTVPCGEVDRTPSKSFAVHSTVTSVIEFDVTEILALESDGTADITVRRSGDIEHKASCEWYIENGNVLKVFYGQLSPKMGRVEFEKGQELATITVAVPNDPTWNVESVYFVNLREVPGEADTHVIGVNQKVGVYSLNTDPFPAGAPPGSSTGRLLWGFIVHNYTEIPLDTEIGLWYAVFPAINYYVSAMVLSLLLDCGIKADSECSLYGYSFEGGRALLFPLAFMELILFYLEFLVSRLQMRLRLGGKAVRMLRTNMFATMLQLSHDSKQMFDQGDVAKALDTQVDMAIKTVWLPFFKLVSAVLELLVKFFLTIQSISGSSGIDMGAKAMVYGSSPIMLLIVAGILNRRSGKQFHMHQKALVADDNWSAFVTMCEACTVCILNYAQGYNVASTFNDVHARYNKASAAAGDYSTLSIWLMKIWFNLVAAIITVQGGLAVQEGNLQVGSFVVLIGAVKGFGSTLVSVAETMNTMVIGVAAVRKVADILNMETRRRVRLRRDREGLPGYTWSDSVENIILQNIRYDYPGAADHNNPAVPLFRLVIPSGYLVCFTRVDHGPDTNGVSLGIQTLFKMLVCELFPASGTICFPSRWRCVCIPVVPLLFDATLMYNLAYNGDVAPEEIIWEVCEGLGLSKDLLGKEDFDVGSNGENMKFADRIIITIARALVADTDMLLMESAIDVLGEKQGVHVLRYLKKYIHHRGVPDFDFAQRPLGLRHSKTVLYPTKFAALEQEAELVVKKAGESLDQESVAVVNGQEPSARKLPELSKMAFSLSKDDSVAGQEIYKQKTDTEELKRVKKDLQSITLELQKTKNELQILREREAERFKKAQAQSPAEEDREAERFEAQAQSPAKEDRERKTGKALVQPGSVNGADSNSQEGIQIRVDSKIARHDSTAKVDFQEANLDLPPESFHNGPFKPPESYKFEAPEDLLKSPPFALAGRHAKGDGCVPDLTKTCLYSQPSHMGLPAQIVDERSFPSPPVRIKDSEL